MNFTSEDIKLLNTNKGLKHLYKTPLKEDGSLNFEKTLRTVKYERELEKLQIELIKLQKWVVDNKKRVVILFEGRDAAGKGGAIRRITHHLNPREFRIVALPKPTDEELGQWYFQRYIKQLPNRGEIVFFDRSWYNRAVVEPVNGFCTEQEYSRFMNEVNDFENMLIHDGVLLIKFYFSISKEEQQKRFQDISNNPLKRWKMTPVDEHAQELWEQYTHYKLEMMKKTNTEKAPWKIIKANRKTEARLEAVQHVLSTIPYK